MELVKKNHFNTKLACNAVVTSMVVRLVRSVEIVQMVESAGYDAFYIDEQHCVMSPEEMSQICLAALHSNVTPFVRVPELNSVHINRVLDAGAMGVIVPDIQNAHEAAQVVQAARFPPLGTRPTYAGLPHCGMLAISGQDACDALNKETTVIIMIETTNALEQVEEIAAVEGVDVLLIGTQDLSAAMGIPGQVRHAKITQAYQKTIQACENNKKYAGIGGLSGDPTRAKEFIKMGAKYISVGADFKFLMEAATAKVKAFSVS